MRKWFSRKFILLTLLFIEAFILKFNGKIGDTSWLIASIVGVFGFVAVVAFLQYKGVYDKQGGK